MCCGVRSHRYRWTQMLYVPAAGRGEVDPLVGVVESPHFVADSHCVGIDAYFTPAPRSVTFCVFSTSGP
jgi:hypothetical protein